MVFCIHHVAIVLETPIVVAVVLLFRSHECWVLDVCFHMVRHSLYTHYQLWWFGTHLDSWRLVGVYKEWECKRSDQRSDLLTRPFCSFPSPQLSSTEFLLCFGIEIQSLLAIFGETQIREFSSSRLKTAVSFFRIFSLSFTSLGVKACSSTACSA